MVRGLDLFKEHFKDFSENYVLIGGTACSILMEEAGAPFRATKDLDIVLIAEALEADFVKAMWDFIKLGRYQRKQKGDGKKNFYRFERPEDSSYPFMLELFSRIPEQLTYEGEGMLTPLPVEEEISSLSAILLNEEYYSYLLQGKEIINEIPLLKTAALIPFKAKAWIDLTERKAKGESIDSRAIKKHKNDVFRLSLILDEESAPLPGTIADDMLYFLGEMSKNPPDLKSLHIRGISFENIRERLYEQYNLTPKE